MDIFLVIASVLLILIILMSTKRTWECIVMGITLAIITSLFAQAGTMGRQLRKDISFAINIFFKRCWNNFWATLFLLGEDSWEDGIVRPVGPMEDEEDEPKFEVLSITPKEEIVPPPYVPPPSLPRRRARMQQIHQLRQQALVRLQIHDHNHNNVFDHDDEV